MKTRIISLSILFYMCSCGRTYIPEVYIKSTEWILDEGDINTVGDILIFDSTQFYTLSHDTIFRLNSPAGIIYDVDTLQGVLKMKSMDGRQSGIWLDLNKKYKY